MMAIKTLLLFSFFFLNNNTVCSLDIKWILQEDSCSCTIMNELNKENNVVAKFTTVRCDEKFTKDYRAFCFAMLHLVDSNNLKDAICNNKGDTQQLKDINKSTKKMFCELGEVVFSHVEITPKQCFDGSCTVITMAVSNMFTWTNL